MIFVYAIATLVLVTLIHGIGMFILWLNVSPDEFNNMLRFKYVSIHYERDAHVIVCFMPFLNIFVFWRMLFYYIFKK